MSIKDSLLNTATPGIELIKSMNLTEEELRTFRLNEYFNVKDNN